MMGTMLRRQEGELRYAEEPTGAPLVATAAVVVVAAASGEP